MDKFETSEISTLDHTKCAVALMQLHDYKAYDDFCREAVRQFAGTTDPVIAERTVKNSLLRAPDANLLASLAPLAEVAVKSMALSKAPGAQAWMFSWRCLSLALYDYRTGNYPGAMDWCHRCLGYGDGSLARVSSVRVILALCENKLGNSAEARTELATGRQLIEKQAKAGMIFGNGDQGFWFDWVLSEILEREAIADIEGPDGPQK